MTMTTQAELDALPDVTPQIVPETRQINGRNVIVPVQVGFIGALYIQPEDGEFRCARTGGRYLVGWVRGVRVKRLLTA